MFIKQNIYCSECQKCIAFKAQDGHGTGPIYCLSCEERVTKKAAEYRAEQEAIQAEYRERVRTLAHRIHT